MTDPRTKLSPGEGLPPGNRGTWHPCLALLVAATLLLCGGCGNRLVFTPKPGAGATPGTYGIAYRQLRLSVADGITLTGWQLDGRPELPLIVYFHGNNSNLSDCLEYVRLFNRLGFPVCAIDYRGHGRSTGNPIQEEDYYEDGRAVLDFLEEHGWNRQGMIYFGQSIGAAVALQMALEKPPAGLVLESPFTNIPDLGRHLAPVGYRLLGWSIDCRFDNYAKIGSLLVPLLVVQAQGDPTIPPEMSLRLFARAPEPKFLHVYQGDSHCEAPTDDGDGIVAALTAFSSLVGRGSAGRQEMQWSKQ